MAAHSHDIEIDLNERFSFTAKLKRNILTVLVLGLVFTAIGLVLLATGGDGHDHHATVDAAQDLAGLQAASAANAEGHGYHWIQRVYANLWINNVYFVGLSLIGIFFFAIQYVANAGWSVGLLRVMSAMGGFLPFMAISMLVVFGLAYHDLFHWTHAGLYDKFLEDGMTPNPEYDPIIAGKQGFLNLPFYVVRMVFFFAVWMFFAYALRKRSLEEDLGGGTQYFRRLVRMSVGFLLFFGVSSSVSAWDWVMSIDTHWFSTMFGWYVFASWFVTGLATITLITIILKEMGHLTIVNENHLHDMGKFVFGFSIFWTYIWFSQFLLIYYANIPEETIYFVERLKSDHYSKFIFTNLFLNFFIPFLGLMTRDAKRKFTLLKIVCVSVVVGHWFDFYLMITPGTLKEHGGLHFFELGLAMVYFSAFAYVVFNTLSKAPLVPKNHPMLQESIHHTT